ncbi:targeting protein for Xklp2 [Hyalella azteca]|uniref:Targeting protein for Xklp2 n=1 Tax=Hyalella azteca TaxID=294128 RepID=A0A8B7PFZ2_HYAAZ|nr:targeting protein for Xklp2 [Hyalella azteca]
MDQSSTFYDERYEFNAPQKYIDFTNFQDDENEDSFFDCQNEGQAQSLSDLQAAESKAGSSSKSDGANAMEKSTEKLSSLNCETPNLISQTSDKPLMSHETGRNAIAMQIEEPSAMQSDELSAMQIEEPTTMQTEVPLAMQTEVPSAMQTEVPSAMQTEVPSAMQTEVPSAMQTEEPTAMQSEEPSAMQAEVPSAIKTEEPSAMQTEENASGTTQLIDPSRLSSTSRVDISEEQMETNETDEKRVTRSCRKGPLGSDGVFQQPPMRHSPRLAAIAKALNTSGGQRNSSSGFKGRRRSVSASPGLRSNRSKSTCGPLSAEDRAHLTQFAEVADPNARNSRRSASFKGGRVSTTKPVAFNFATDSRLKSVSKTTLAAPVLASAADFARTLRSTAKNATATSHAPRGPTKPQPFNLSEGKKHNSAEADQQKTKFVSLAELNMKFHSQTPQRFRTVPKKEESCPKRMTRSGSSSSLPSVTRPQSPHLSTRSRSRPVNHPTREQIEEQEMLEAQKHQVKAHPVNPKIFEPPKLSTNAEAKGCTIPSPFNITDAKKRLLRRKQEKVEEIIAKEKAMAEFHAHPMPVFDDKPKGLPSKKTPSVTKPEPFVLQIDKRAESKQLAMEREQREREEREREMRNFHARPATVIAKEPFLPARSHKPLTEISGFDLNTEKRSKERYEYDVHLKQKEDEIMAKKRHEEELRAAEEEAQVAEERKRNVHHAKPMPQYKTLSVQRSDKPVTTPLSPKFATDSRLRSSRSRLNINNTTSSSTCSSAHNTTVTR